MSGLTTHGCGKSWRQRGNRTSHCGGCHETFEGLTLFDAHLVHGKDGSLTHQDPAQMQFNGKSLAFDGSHGDGSWRRTDLTDSAFEASGVVSGALGAEESSEAVEAGNRDVREAVLS
ncbi:hypothetical protein CQ044_00030 [Microbacterium sp. MYb64]|nr:hypothetical protein CQ044_00030 [Microbacterium sp. MYb64]